MHDLSWEREDAFVGTASLIKTLDFLGVFSLPFQITKVSDQGTANPIVARLSVQTSELIKFCPRGEEFHKSVLELFHDHIQKQLLECDQISQEISREILEINAKLGKGGIKTQAMGRVVEVPHIIRLIPRIEQFLYCAKSALRDLARIFDLFFGKAFDAARYDKIIEWAEKEFGNDLEPHESCDKIMIFSLKS